MLMMDYLDRSNWDEAASLHELTAADVRSPDECCSTALALPGCRPSVRERKDTKLALLLSLLRMTFQTLNYTAFQGSRL